MGHAVNKNRIGTIVEPPSIRTYWPPTVAFCPASLGLYYGAFPDRPALTGLSGEMQPVGFPGPTAAYPEAGGTSPKGSARNPNRGLTVWSSALALFATPHP